MIAIFALHVQNLESYGNNISNKKILLDAFKCQFVHNGKKKHISAQEQVLNAAAQTYTYTCNKDNQIRILYVKGSSNDTYCLCSL